MLKIMVPNFLLKKSLSLKKSVVNKVVNFTKKVLLIELLTLEKDLHSF